LSSGEAEVQIRVTDTNDNAPYFRDQLYSAHVPENAEPGSVIIAVTAEDRDEENRLTYSITGGNIGGAFEVVPELGELKVRSALDYEAGPRVRFVYPYFVKILAWNRIKLSRLTTGDAETSSNGKTMQVTRIVCQGR
jgi:Cadherin domain